MLQIPAEFAGNVSSPISSATELLASLQTRANALLAELRSYQDHLQAHQRSNDVEIRVFRRGVESEVKSLDTISKRHAVQDAETLCPSDDEREEGSKRLHVLRSSNLPFYEAVWDAARKSRGVVALGKRMHWRQGNNSQLHALSADADHHEGDVPRSRKSGVLVDVVAENGLEWIKVSTTTEKRLLFEMAKEGWENYGEESDDDWDNCRREGSGVSRDTGKLELIRLAEDLRSTAKASRIRFQHPKIRFILPKIREHVIGDVDAVIADLRATGAIVDCGTGDDENFSPASSSMSVTDQTTFNTMLPSPTIPNLTSTLNIDCTILLALISDISHLPRHFLPPAPNAHGTYHIAILRQIESEESSPLLPQEIYPVLANRRLECTLHAAQRMREIVDTMGTANERQRAEIVFGEGSFQGECPEALRKAVAEHSSYPVPRVLQLPIHVIDFEPSILQKPSLTPGFPVAVATRMASDLRLSLINSSVFLYGWAQGVVTMTSNRVVAAGIVRTVNEILDVDEIINLDERATDVQHINHSAAFVGPEIYVCETARSLVGKDKNRRDG